MPARIGLSTSSVYPESTAHGFAYAARLGYDAIEVMVGIDALSQQTAAVRQLSEHHGIPICAIHAPTLLLTQRAWGTDAGGGTNEGPLVRIQQTRRRHSTIPKKSHPRRP